MAKIVSVPTKKGKKESSDTLEITQAVAQADAVVAAKAAMEQAAARFEETRAALEPVVKQAQRSAEINGTFTKKVVVLGTDKNASFGFGNSFSAMDVGCRHALEKLLGPHFNTLFTEKQIVKVRAGALERLQKAIETAGLNPDDFFETDRSIVPVPEFRKARFELRSQLDRDQNEAVDSVIDQLAARPTLTVG